MSELVTTRQALNVSQRALSAELHRSQTALVRMERLANLDRISFVEVAQMASLLGLELGAGLYPLGDPIRDKGHQALLKRFRARLSPIVKVMAEVPLSNAGDRRSWDLFLTIVHQRVGVEAETRIPDGGADEVLLILGESAVNRRLLPDLLEALGPRFVTPPRLLLKYLREGRPLPGSGVLLL